MLLSPSSFPHYRPAPSYTFHAYSPPASPLPFNANEDTDIAPPAMSAKRASRLSAPFPTFLYANEPPPVTARNKQRVRPTPAQLADLKALYAATAHPTREEREALGRRIGMRYQSVTNWFQNQRSTAKKRGSGSATNHDEEHEQEHEHDEPEEYAPPPSPPMPQTPKFSAVTRRTDPVRDIIAQSTRPPPPSQSPYIPLPLSGSSIVPTLPPPPVHTPSPIPLLSSFHVLSTPSPPKPAKDRHQAGRSKRSRPTPHQLAVLRALHAETSSPSIEERVRVGAEIGMELGKVTNWFRNLRQTARKKERRALAAEDDEEDAGKRRRGDAGGPRKRMRVMDDEDDSVFSEPEPDMDVESTESDAAHEAVTPEPVGSTTLDPPPHAHHNQSTNTSPTYEKERPGPAASVDDALLLLALHDAR